MKPDKDLTQKSYISPDFQFMGRMWENCNYGPKILNKKVILELTSIISKFPVSTNITNIFF